MAAEPMSEARLAEIEATLGGPGGDLSPNEQRVLLAEVRSLREKLAQPCGSCHPCTEWANQTWVNAGVRLPHVHEWQEMRERVAELEAERSMLTQWIWDQRTAFGFDPDGDQTPRAMIAGAGSVTKWLEQVAQDFQEERDYMRQLEDSA